MAEERTPQMERLETLRRRRNHGLTPEELAKASHRFQAQETLFGAILRVVGDIREGLLFRVFRVKISSRVDFPSRFFPHSWVVKIVQRRMWGVEDVLAHFLVAHRKTGCAGDGCALCKEFVAGIIACSRIYEPAPKPQGPLNQKPNWVNILEEAGVINTQEKRNEAE